MKVAVVGAGISGMLVAYLLHEDVDLVVFEANDYLGGHTHTVSVELDGKAYALDTGFIVHNDRTYPAFIRLMERLGVATEPSNMSFGVKCEKTGLEYRASSLNTLFAQRRNLLRPAFYRMLRDAMRFNRDAPKLLDGGSEETLGEYLEREGFGPEFREQYLVPMASSIWSADPARLASFPARTLVQFFHNHGFLTWNRHPEWRVVRGGSQRYVEALTRPFRDRIQLETPVVAVRRHADGVELTTRDGTRRHVDRVVLATHSDQALALLKDPSPDEKSILGALPYQENDGVLHTDRSLLPRNRRAWASWNYHVLKEPQGRVVVTYNLNMLQNLSAPTTFCVTLNRSDAIDPRSILARMTYHHPVIDRGALAAKREHARINGVNRTYYCGAYWGYGFHEDGVQSALAVATHFGKRL